jgi:hypothetical protein
LSLFWTFQAFPRRIKTHDKSVSRAESQKQPKTQIPVERDGVELQSKTTQRHKNNPERETQQELRERVNAGEKKGRMRKLGRFGRNEPEDLKRLPEIVMEETSCLNTMSKTPTFTCPADKSKCDCLTTCPSELSVDCPDKCNPVKCCQGCMAEEEENDDE